MSNNVIKKYPFISFYTLAILIVLGVMGVYFILVQSDPKIASLVQDCVNHIDQSGKYTNIVEIARYASNVHWAAWLIIIFASAPTISAVVVSVAGNRGTGLKRLFSRLKPWRNGVSWQKGLTVYGIYALIYCAVAALYFWALAAKGEPGQYDQTIQSLGGMPIAVLFTILIGAFIDEGGTCEELGWRGFALPILMEKMRSPLTASIVLGVLWAAWHLPRELPALLAGVNPGNFFFLQSLFFLSCILQSIIITYMFIKTGGSAWAGILIHGGTNVWSKAIGSAVTLTPAIDIRLMVFVVAAAVILIIAGPSLGSGTKKDIP